MKKSFCVTTVFTGAAACAAAFAPAATAEPATLGATMATANPGHFAAAAAATPCIEQTFGRLGVYRACVADEQVLLNDLWYYGKSHHLDLGPNQHLSTDGYYGPKTASDVYAFNKWYFLSGGSVTSFNTWSALCGVDYSHGFRGTYWHNAGCSAFF